MARLSKYLQGKSNNEKEGQGSHSKQQINIIIYPIFQIQSSKSMGNVKEAIIHKNSLKGCNNQLQDISNTLLIGPSNVLFQKLNPKIVDANEDMLTLEQQSVGRQYSMRNRNQEDDGLDDYSENSSRLIRMEEAIKIKWNSFIKMKKKSYLEDYTIVSQIGKGGFGTVSKVKAKYTGVMRAAKKIKKSSLAKEQHQKLFAEMAIMITLDHPNIARLFQVYDHKSSYVLILQLCEGGELFKRIVNQSITQSMAAGFMAKLLNALLYIHAKGIIHRDLKPQNILLQTNKPNSNLKLIDFGIAIKRENKQKLSTRIGTPYYIAPEVLCKSYDQKCDIWSAGIILYMMICYRPPFSGESQAEVMQNILKQQPKFTGIHFKKLSEGCIDLLKKMLTKNPQTRPSALQAFQHPWIQKYLQSSSTNHQSTLQNISTFKFSNKLQAVVYTFIVSQILTSEQKETIKELFQMLDQNHDGVISSYQLRKALLSKKEIDQDRINFLMRVIDTNNSGMIDFTQFIVAALEPQTFNRTHFQQAFSYFDIDHSGVITYDEIASFLEDKQHSQEQIGKIFRQIDQNHDGQISKQQFLKVLCLKGKERRDRSKTKNGLKQSKHN